MTAARFEPTTRAPVGDPTTRPPACVLYVDGVRVADGTPGDDPTAPNVLEDLRVTWGRANSVDQPSPATATFDVIDQRGGQTYLDVLHIGARIDIDAAATLYPDPTVPQITDPDLAGNPIPAGRYAATNATVTFDNRTGTGGNAIRPKAWATPATVTYGPAPATHPTDWDAVPVTRGGESWQYGARISATLATAAVLIRPVMFTTANPAKWSIVPGAGEIRATAVVGAPVAYVATCTPPPGVWLGVQIVAERVGPRWIDLAPTLKWTDLGAAAPTWSEWSAVVVDALTLLAPTAGTERRGRVFSGRVTDLEAAWSDDVEQTVVTVTAQDDVAELDNRYVGETPWATETLAARAARIVTASGQPITLNVDPTIAAVSIAARDVDAQGAAGLLESLATSVAGVLWCAASLGAGSFLRIEDVDARPAMMVLVMRDGVIVIEPASFVDNPDGPAITLDACEIELLPIRWTQTVEDVATRVSAQWRDVATNPPTDRTETIIDAALETRIGRRHASVSTELAVQSAAITTATRLLGRLATPNWRVAGIAWAVPARTAVDSDTLRRMMAVLDGVTRLGLPIMLTGLPDWSPISQGADLPLYLEGGVLRHHGGAWELDLLTSSAAAQGAADVKWTDLPADWQWNELDPAIQWFDLNGVGV